jgi:hypothetical protein
MVGQFECTFVGPGPQAGRWIRPGQTTQQDYLDINGAEWILYSRSVMSYSIAWRSDQFAEGGASLEVELGSTEGAAGAPIVTDTMAFHLVGEHDMVSHQSDIPLPGLMARFQVRTCNNIVGEDCIVFGSIIVRAL